MIADILFFLNFCLFAFAPACFCAVFAGMRTEKAFLPCFLFNSLLFYIFASFHLPEAGFRILYAANLCLIAPVLIRGRRIGFRKTAEQILTPGAVILFLTACVSFFLCRNMEFDSWDAISHWGKIVRLFLSDGKLGCEYPSSVLMHASYPPGTCLTSVLVHLCFFGRPMQEGIVIFAYNLLNFAAMIWIFSFFRIGQKARILFLLPVFFLILPILTELQCFYFCYTDSILAFFTALAFWELLSLPEDFRVQELFSFAIINAWLFMIRNAGWGYAIGLLAVCAILLFQNRKTVFAPQKNNRFPIWKTMLIAVSFLLPILIKLSWLFQLARCRTTIRLGGDKITWQELCLLFESPDAPGWLCLRKFFLSLLHGYLEAFVLLLIAAILLYKRSREKKIRRGIAAGLFFFSSLFLCFLVTLLLLYLCEFRINTGDLPSFPRYLNSFLLIPAFLLLLVAARGFANAPELPIDRIHLPRRPVSVIALLTVLIVLFSLGQHKLLEIADRDAPAYRRWRGECNRILKYDALLNEKDVLFTVQCSTGNGFKSFYLSYLYPEHFRDTEFWDPVLPEKAESKRPYAVPVTPEQLRAEWKNFRYVYMDNPDEEFSKDYATLFQGNPPDRDSLCNRLFRVTEEGLLIPVPEPDRR